MAPEYISLLSALAGALIGGLASVGGIFISGRLESRRQLTRLAYEAGQADFKLALENAGNGGPRRVMPLTSFIYFHVKYMQLIEGGSLSKESLEKLRKEVDALWSMPPRQ